MRIAILHMHFNDPFYGGPLRTYLLGKALVGRGFNVEVFTVSDSNHSGIAELEGMRVHYLPVKYDNKFSFLRRVWSFYRFHISSLRKIKSLPKFDLLYAVSTPLTTGFTALKLLNNKNLKYVFEVGDLWPEAPIQMGVINNNYLKRKLYELERRIYDKAELIVGMSPAITDYIENVSSTKVITVPNFSDTEYFTPKTPDLFNPFIITYSGALGKANHLEYIIDAAEALIDLPILFQVMGDGGELPALKKKARGLNNINFLPFGNRKQVKEVLENSHAVYISYKSIPVLETGSPNKLFDALAAGKPVIINFGGWIENLITENVCGIRTDPLNPEDLKEKVTDLLNKNVWEEYSKNAHKLSKRFDKNASISKIEAALRVILAQ